MIIGLVIIAWGISQAVQYPKTVTPAAIASIAGVITNLLELLFSLYTVRQLNKLLTLTNIQDASIQLEWQCRY